MKQDRISARAFYNVFKSEWNIHYPNDPLPDYREFRDTVNAYFLDVKTAILGGHEVKLPVAMGSLHVRSNKIEMKIDNKGKVKGLMIDWKATNEYRERTGKKKYVYHMNDHTEGFTYKINWNQKKCNTKNNNYYNFYPCRTFKRDLAKEIIDNNQRYF